MARFAGMGRERLASLALAIGWWPLCPVLAVVQLWTARRPGVRRYLAPGRDAVLTVRATHGVWVLEDHLSAEPGRGRGKRLRQLVAGPLPTQADPLHVAIEATAATPEPAAAYATDLAMDGHGRLGRGIRARRPAQGSGSSERGYSRGMGGG